LVGLSPGEMLAMIKFGADEIFSSKDSTITDEDIDLIIAKNKERSELENEKIKKNMQNLLDLKLDGGSQP
jgi:SWI/SNF-related matrix-associated actin-dependent regulator of chromatin subfamily A member 5